MPHCFRRRLAVFGIALAAVAVGAAAQQVGDKTVRFILPNATGSGVDAITRAAQPALAKALGYAVVIDNQPGAGAHVVFVDGADHLGSRRAAQVAQFFFQPGQALGSHGNLVTHKRLSNARTLEKAAQKTPPNRPRGRPA